jgi:hypothetical protein
LKQVIAASFHSIRFSSVLAERRCAVIRHALRYPSLVPVRLLTLKAIILFPLHHATVHNHPWFSVLDRTVMSHAPTVLATVVAQFLRAPHVRLCFAFDLDFLWLVVCPEGAVAAADGAQAFVGGFAEGWEGDADGFAVTGYLEARLL